MPVRLGSYEEAKKYGIKLPYPEKITKPAKITKPKRVPRPTRIAKPTRKRIKRSKGLIARVLATPKHKKRKTLSGLIFGW